MMPSLRHAAKSRPVNRFETFLQAGYRRGWLAHHDTTIGSQVIAGRKLFVRWESR